MRKSAIAIVLGAIMLVLVWFVSSGSDPLTAAQQAEEEREESTGSSRQDGSDSSGRVTVAAAGQLDGAMRLAAESDELRLYISPETAEVAVQVKRDGRLWHSNPPTRQQDEGVTPLFQSLLSSQLTLTYYTEGGQVKSFNSYADSVARSQFGITDIPGGVKVDYTFGNVVKGLDVIPLAISQERFETDILARIEDEELRMRVQLRFNFDKEKLIYTPRQMQNFVIEEMAEVLESIGYTREEAAKDNEANGVEAPEENSFYFSVPVEYRLDGGELLVSIPTEELSYPDKAPIQSIQLLEYFGAAGTADEGYMFVPDGSGALIYLNNGKPGVAAYDSPVYGLDETIIRKERIQTNESIRFPLFGMVKGNAAFLAVIEEGDAIASVTADTSGRNHGYNSVSTRFDLMKMDYITLTSGSRTSSLPVFQSDIYKGELRVSYQFLDGETASYSGMASLYRERLAKEQQWERLSAESALPFVMQLEGAFAKQKSFLGIPYKSAEALTTFEEAALIAGLLQQEGVERIKLRYEGWLGGGLRHASPSKLKAETKLGGTKGLARLTEYLEQEGIAFYPDVAIQRKFKGSSGAAMLLNKKKAKAYNYDPVTFMEDKSKPGHYVLSPNLLTATVESMLKSSGRLELSGLSLSDLGGQLNSDYDRSRFVDRQTAKRIVQDSLDAIGDALPRVMVSGGNAYALKHADTVVNAPLRSSRYQIIDEDVPFYQMVLHGYIDYAAAPWNMAEIQDLDWQLLKALETGSSIYFQWIHVNPSVLKGTDYDYLYSAHYDDWLQDAVAHYKELSAVLERAQGQTIADHRKLLPGVYQTTFENGLRVIVNYGDSAADIGGIAVGPKSYWAGGES